MPAVEGFEEPHHGRVEDGFHSELCGKHPGEDMQRQSDFQV